MSNSTKKNTSLTLGEDKLLAVGVQKYPCLYDKSHRSHKEKNMVQNACEAAANELNFVEKTFAIFDVFIDNIFYPFLLNVPFKYPGIATLRHCS